MKKLQLKTNPELKRIFNNYPKEVQEKLIHLRKLVQETAQELEEINELEETLKWGEPSFLVKNGSTIRIDWKEKSPEQYAMYFKCTSLLVSTFKSVFKDEFQYEGNRAIVFKLDEEIPQEALKKCIQAALRYHKVKGLPQLGIETSK